MAYTVVTPACSVYLASGAVTLLYKGAQLPASSELREGEAKRLKDGGFVESESAAPKEPTAAEKKAAEKAAADAKAAEEKAAAEKAAADKAAADKAGSGS